MFHELNRILCYIISKATLNFLKSILYEKNFEIHIFRKHAILAFGEL